MKNKLAIALLVAGTAVALTGCSSAPALSAAAAAPAGHTVSVDGFPLDRSLDGLATSQFDVAVVVSGLQVAPAVWLTEDGLAPAYVKTGVAPTEEEAATPTTVVTPIASTVTESLWGGAGVGAPLLFQVAGGTADGVTVDASGEVGASIDEIAQSGSVLIAGTIEHSKFGDLIDPHFVYALSADGETATSLMESAGDDLKPVFTMTELRERLAARQAEPEAKK